MMAYDYPHPVSRTYQYKKITKPLLERKRRARINRCLEELKDLMVDALETEGENISKLEKADILELTVRHLQTLQTSRPSGLSSTISNEDAIAESRWQSGFGHCAAEACKYLASLPGESGEKLARHLATGLQSAQKIALQANSIQNTADVQGQSDPTVHQISSVTSSVNAASLSTSPFSSTIISKQVLSPSNSLSYSESQVKQFSTSKGSIVTEIDATFNPQIHSSTSISPTTQTIHSNNSQSCVNMTNDRVSKGDDDEEIDVEGIDESDPMWRPW